MRWTRWTLAIMGAYALVNMACTEVGLYLPETSPVLLEKKPNTVTGTFCTEDPGLLRFPLKVWFIIDDSGSMQSSDANQRRYAAAKEVATKLAKAQEVYFGGQVFSGEKTERFSNPRFTDDVAKFHVAVDSVASAGSGQTPYLAALQLATSELEADIAESGNATRSRYVILFLSDGSPTDAQEAQILAALDSLLGLQTRMGGLAFNTLFLGNSSSSVGPERLLMNMAARGNGLYKSFVTGDALDYGGFDYSSIRRTYNLRGFALVNRNMMPSGEGQLVDSDGDGLPDAKERELGTDVRTADTDGDGCSDLMETRVSWDPLVPGKSNGQCQCRNTDLKDTDGDGLTDCEESWLGTNKDDPDSDLGPNKESAGDLIPDGMDYVYLQDPTFSNTNTDRDRDGTSDLAEFEQHTDINFAGNDSRAAWAYVYDTFEPQPDNPRCHRFVVRNVALGPTLKTADKGENENVLELYFVQSPQDNPHAERLFRVARVNVPFAEGGRSITVTPEDFSTVLTSGHGKATP